MRGFPKYLNTKKDYENVLKEFGYTKKVKNAYKGLLNSTEKYIFDKELNSKNERNGKFPDFKVMTEKKEDGSEKIIQFKKVKNEKGKLFKLGFTIEEVKEVINK
jgi:hypothetical protein